MNNLCFIDFETSGTDVYNDSPIEIGAVLFDTKGRLISEFQSFIKPRTKRRFSKSAINIHGLYPNDLLNAPTQKNVLDDFFEKFGTDFRFAGWNINFDVSFFRNMCYHSQHMRSFDSISHRHIDVQSISFFLTELNILDKDIRSLTDLSNYFLIKRRDNHSAIEDAKITAKVFYKMKEFLLTK